MADAYTGMGRNKRVAKRPARKQVAVILPVKVKKTPKNK